MEKIDFKERQKYLRNLITQDGIKVKDGELYVIDELFEKVMGENRHKNKTRLEQISLLEGIAEQYLSGDDVKRIFTSRSDNAHMNYFDIFLDNQSDIIVDALKRNGLSTDVLKNKGIKQNINLDTTKNGLRIIQEIEEDDEGYKNISKFQIYYNGELIYDYKNKAIENNYLEIEEIPEEYYLRSDRKERINVVIKKEVTTDGTYTYEKSINKKGTEVILKRDSKGRFAK